jgi:ubiquinone/menaquinone biosynthesis C-methylase UbiE
VHVSQEQNISTLTDDQYFLNRYLSVAPIPLALVRAIDCRHIAAQPLDGKILDIGCGDGLFAEILFRGQKGRVSVGVDVNPQELRKADRTEIYQNLIQADSAKLSLPDNEFDTVLCNSVLEHIENVDSALTEICRVLKPSGKFIFTVPSEYLSGHFLFAQMFERIGLKRLARWYKDTKNKVWKHYHLDPPAVWEKRLMQCGMKIEKLSYIHPEVVTKICDLFTLSGALSKLWLKLLGRYLLFPGNFRARIFSPFLRNTYFFDSKIGSSIFVVAVKI